MIPRLKTGPTFEMTRDDNGYLHITAPADYIHVVGDDPVETHNAMRDSGNVGGVVVYRAGRTYSRPFGDASGVCKVPSSMDKPLILISDDSAPERPTLLPGGTGACFSRQSETPAFVWMNGLLTLPGSGESGASWIGPGEFFVEDMEMRNGQTGMNIAGNAGGSPRVAASLSIIHGQRYGNGHANGIFVGAAGAMPHIAQCVLDDVGSTNMEHLVYVTGGSGRLHLSLNILTRAVAGHAAQGRGGIVAGDNFIARCPAGLLAGGGDNATSNEPTGVSAIVCDNVFQDATGIGWGLELSNVREGTVRGNLWTMGDNAAFAIRLQGKTAEARTGIGCKGVKIADNVWDRWRGGMEVVDGENGTVQIASMRGHGYKPVAPGRTVQTYYRTLINDIQTVAKLPDGGTVTMVNPQPGDFERFIAAAKKATNYHSFDPRYGAAAVNKFLRAGWGMP